MKRIITEMTGTRMTRIRQITRILILVGMDGRKDMGRNGSREEDGTFRGFIRAPVRSGGTDKADRTGGHRL